MGGSRKTMDNVRRRREEMLQRQQQAKQGSSSSSASSALMAHVDYSKYRDKQNGRREDVTDRRDERREERREERRDDRRDDRREERREERRDDKREDKRDDRSRGDRAGEAKQFTKLDELLDSGSESDSAEGSQSEGHDDVESTQTAETSLMPASELPREHSPPARSSSGNENAKRRGRPPMKNKESAKEEETKEQKREQPTEDRKEDRKEERKGRKGRSAAGADGGEDGDEAEDFHHLPRSTLLRLSRSCGVTHVSTDVVPAIRELMGMMVSSILNDISKSSNNVLQTSYINQLINNKFKDGEGILSDDTFISNSAFGRFVAPMFQKSQTVVKKDALILLQFYCEAYVMKLVQAGDMIASSGRRARVQGSDITIAYEIHNL